MKMMGAVVVAAFTARTVGSPPPDTMRSRLRLTSSFASVGRRGSLS
jgi:hypothetical protein